MGRYFRLYNVTKNHTVSGYWKGDSECNFRDVMHQLKWDSTDIIRTACYDTSCYVYINQDTLRHEILEVYEGEDFIELVSRDGDYLLPISSEHQEYLDKVSRERSKTSNIPRKKYGFVDINADHIPQWSGDVCKSCEYKYDESMLPEYEKKFDSVY